MTAAAAKARPKTAWSLRRLLLADLAMGGGKILPAPEECFYMLDEAHNLPEKAVSSFASSHFVNSERRSAEKLANLAAAISDAVGKTHAAQAERIHDEAEQLKENLSIGVFLMKKMFLTLTQLFPGFLQGAKNLMSCFRRC